MPARPRGIDRSILPSSVRTVLLEWHLQLLPLPDRQDRPSRSPDDASARRPAQVPSGLLQLPEQALSPSSSGLISLVIFKSVLLKNGTCRASYTNYPTPSGSSATSLRKVKSRAVCSTGSSGVSTRQHVGPPILPGATLHVHTFQGIAPTKLTTEAALMLNSAAIKHARPATT